MNVDDLKVGNCASMEKEADGHEERGYCVGEEGGTVKDGSVDADEGSDANEHEQVRDVECLG